jgi:hypothetical protein
MHNGGNTVPHADEQTNVGALIPDKGGCVYLPHRKRAVVCRYVRGEVCPVSFPENSPISREYTCLLRLEVLRDWSFEIFCATPSKTSLSSLGFPSRCCKKEYLFGKLYSLYIETFVINFRKGSNFAMDTGRGKQPPPPKDVHMREADEEQRLRDKENANDPGNDSSIDSDNSSPTRTRDPLENDERLNQLKAQHQKALSHADYFQAEQIEKELEQRRS